MIHLGRGQSFKRDISIRVLSLGRGPSLVICPNIKTPGIHLRPIDGVTTNSNKHKRLEQSLLNLPGGSVANTTRIFRFC